MLLPVRHLAGHNLLLQLPVNLLADQDQAAPRAGGGEGSSVATLAGVLPAAEARGPADDRSLLPPRPASRQQPCCAAAPQHGAAEAPLVGAVLKQHNLKQRGQDLGEQLRPLPQVLRYRLARGAGGAGGGKGGRRGFSAAKCLVNCVNCNACRLVWAGSQRCPLPLPPCPLPAHCCRGGGALAAGLVLEVVPSQVVHRRRALQGLGRKRAGWFETRKTSCRFRQAGGGGARLLGWLLPTPPAAPNQARTRLRLGCDTCFCCWAAGRRLGQPSKRQKADTRQRTGAACLGGDGNVQRLEARV